MKRLTWLLSLVAVLALAGCAQQQPTQRHLSPSEQATLDSIAASGVEVPSCAKTWVDGKTLSGKYVACKNDTTGETELSQTFACADGTTLVAYNDQFWAHLGGVIHTGGTDSTGYSSAYSTCNPEAATSPSPSATPTF